MAKLIEISRTRKKQITIHRRSPDGSVEVFDREKIKQSLTAAGVDDKNAEDLTSEVGLWVIGEAQEDMVKSEKIWKQITEILEEFDPKIAETYKAYREK